MIKCKNECPLGKFEGCCFFCEVKGCKEKCTEAPCDCDSAIQVDETNATVHVKFAGIEDFWGNVYYWIDGLYSDSSRNILTAFKDFNDTGSGYTSRGQGASSNIGGYMSEPQGTTESGFVVKKTNGSTTTYFADNANLYASGLPSFGGAWDYGDVAGAFQLDVYSSASASYSGLGGRLMYLKAS